MNTYYVQLGMLLEERIPAKQEGYYILHVDDEQISYDLSVPDGIRIITAEDFVHALAEGCKQILKDFSQSSVNEEVYVFVLHPEEQYGFSVYLNTTSWFSTNLSRYTEPDSDYVAWIKYNPGDFAFQFGEKHMGDYGKVIQQFVTIGISRFGHPDGYPKPGGVSSVPQVAFEAGIIEEGYQLLALQAVKRLIREEAFASLHKTKNFIAYSVTENEDLDYAITIRQAIGSGLFYEVFPQLQMQDDYCEREVERYQKSTVGECLDHWMAAVHDSYYKNVKSYAFSKIEYGVFLSLKRFGSDFAQAALERLIALMDHAIWGNEEHYEFEYYMQCVRSSDILTPRLRKMCKELATSIRNHPGFDDDYVIELGNLAK
ncbi:DUF4303 domain-containing protein [Paenibacillus methanolicus]|uniref:Uncharacterized protein DUF4303 n=1 Tax=Paenibacillus methanolicus TaxID=582686 RepID=A0A5S5BT38_9BACL|nr:DUF4303 domain-containing protein [Paenibacillus methanolicus]TYP70209.1 uncharacterized protein DUF4303 [Paenibacillus methanolicus]